MFNDFANIEFQLEMEIAPDYYLKKNFQVIQRYFRLIITMQIFLEIIVLI